MMPMPTQVSRIINQIRSRVTGVLPIVCLPCKPLAAAFPTKRIGRSRGDRQAGLPAGGRYSLVTRTIAGRITRPWSV